MFKREGIDTNELRPLRIPRSRKQVRFDMTSVKAKYGKLPPLYEEEVIRIVLSYLRYDELLMSQKVCRHWYDIRIPEMMPPAMASCQLYEQVCILLKKEIKTATRTLGSPDQLVL